MEGNRLEQKKYLGAKSHIEEERIINKGNKGNKENKGNKGNVQQ